MPTPAVIIDTREGNTARVDAAGALATGPARPSLSFNATLGTDSTPVELVHGKSDQIFCITGFILTGNKNISGTTDATVNIYTSDDPASAVQKKLLVSVPIAKSAQTIVTGIILETEEADHINATTTDDDVFVTLLGFYV